MAGVQLGDKPMTADEIQQLLDDTFSKCPQPYKFLFEMTDFDKALSDLVETCGALSAQDRAVLYEKLTVKQQNMLKGFGVKLSILAVRESDGAKVVQAVQAFAVAGFRQDWRDDYIALSGVLHTMHKLSLDARSVFEDAARIADADGAYHLRHFVGYSPSIESMGVREATAKDGLFTYQPIEERRRKS